MDNGLYKAPFFDSMASTVFGSLSTGRMVTLRPSFAAARVLLPLPRTAGSLPGCGQCFCGSVQEAIPVFSALCRERINIPKACAADAADDVHKVGHVVVHKKDIIHLLTQVKRRHQQHGDRDAARKSRQRCQHDEHKYDARSTQQCGTREQGTLQDARHQGCEHDAFQQRQTSVLFLHGRANDEEQKHIVQEMVPAGMAQHMAKQADIKQRVFQGRAINAE